MIKRASVWSPSPARVPSRSRSRSCRRPRCSAPGRAGRRRRTRRTRTCSASRAGISTTISMTFGYSPGLRMRRVASHLGGRLSSPQGPITGSASRSSISAGRAIVPLADTSSPVSYGALMTRPIVPSAFAFDRGRSRLRTRVPSRPESRQAVPSPSREPSPEGHQARWVEPQQVDASRDPTPVSGRAHPVRTLHVGLPRSPLRTRYPRGGLDQLPRARRRRCPRPPPGSWAHG